MTLSIATLQYTWKGKTTDSQLFYNRGHVKENPPVFLEKNSEREAAHQRLFGNINSAFEKFLRKFGKIALQDFFRIARHEMTQKKP